MRCEHYRTWLITIYEYYVARIVTSRNADYQFIMYCECFMMLIIVLFIVHCKCHATLIIMLCVCDMTRILMPCPGEWRGRIDRAWMVVIQARKKKQWFPKQLVCSAGKCPPGP